MQSPFEQSFLSQLGIDPNKPIPYEINPKTAGTYQELARKAAAKAKGITEESQPVEKGSIKSKPPAANTEPSPITVLDPKGVRDINTQAALSKKQKSGLELNKSRIYLNPAMARAQADEIRQAQRVKGGNSIDIADEKEVLDKQGVANIKAQIAASKRQKSGLELESGKALLNPDEVIKYQEKEFSNLQKSKNAPPSAKAEKIIQSESLGASMVKKFELMYKDVKEVGLEEAEKLHGYSLEDVQKDLLKKVARDFKENYRNPKITNLEARLKDILIPAYIARRLHDFNNRKDKYAEVYADLLDYATSKLLRDSIQNKNAA